MELKDTTHARKYVKILKGESKNKQSWVLKKKKIEVHIKIFAYALKIRMSCNQKDPSTREEMSLEQVILEPMAEIFIA